MRRAPVGHDPAGEVQLRAKQAERAGILTGPHVVDAVVAAHDSGNAGIDGRCKGGHVDLHESPLIDVGAHVAPVLLLVVQDEVLGRGQHSVALNAPHGRRHHRRPEQRIFAGEILKVAAATRHARHIQPGAQLHVGALASELGTHRCTPPTGEIRIPGRGDGESAGPLGGGARCSLVVPIATVSVALRTILERKPRHAHAPDRRDVSNIRVVCRTPTEAPDTVQHEHPLRHVHASHERRCARGGRGRRRRQRHQSRQGHQNAASPRPRVLARAPDPNVTM
eukprot:3909626-Prymnesium_polylepis.2